MEMRFKCSNHITCTLSPYQCISYHVPSSFLASSLCSSPSIFPSPSSCCISDPGLSFPSVGYLPAHDPSLCKPFGVRHGLMGFVHQTIVAFPASTMWSPHAIPFHLRPTSSAALLAQTDSRAMQDHVSVLLGCFCRFLVYFF